MHAPGRDADLRTHAELATVGKLRGGILQQDRTVDFCEEVIRAFPLESELPTSFEVSEHFQLYANQAFQQLLQQSEREEKLQDALQQLYKPGLCDRLIVKM